ncbi:unnamed protein product [Lupinus luteus]|uniref:Uncharacterized protein n=1 Tax=Lupinus luteus TaxID=3873 RepID=A0AAV1XRT3_LUPLU
MGRAPCCDKANVKRGPWSPEEDATLRSYIETHGTGGNWIALPRKAGLSLFLWSAIASKLHGRTDNDVKNYWNTKLKKKLMAGKVCIQTLTDNHTLTSIPLLTQNSDFHASQIQNSIPNLSTGACSEFNISGKNMSFGLIDQLYSPEVVSSSRNNNNNPLVSLSQEGSSISDSSSIAMNNKCEVLAEHSSDHESTELLIDFGFEFPYDLINGLDCNERVSEFSLSGYPEWVDFSFVDIKP